MIAFWLFLERAIMSLRMNEFIGAVAEYIKEKWGKWEFVQAKPAIASAAHTRDASLSVGDMAGILFTREQEGPSVRDKPDFPTNA